MKTDHHQMPRLTNWKVRVRRATEDWVLVQAYNAKDAEDRAAAVPGVLSVFPGTTVRGDEADRPLPPPGVEEE